MPYNESDVTVIILSGGLGRRMGNVNKGLVELDGIPLISHVIKQIKQETDHILISANNDISEYKNFGFPVITDKFDNNQGPLAGILSCQFAIKTSLIATIPCDVPLLAHNYLPKMINAYNLNENNQLCVAHDGKRLQNLLMLFNRQHLERLNEYFNTNHRKVSDWIHSQTYKVVSFKDQQSQFTNINTTASLNELEKQISLKDG